MKAQFKKLSKRFAISVYSPFVKRFLRRNKQIKLIGISGSVGKTSTKFAVVAALNGQYKNKIISHSGSFNDPLASIFVLLGLPYPELRIWQLIRSLFKIIKASKKYTDAEFAILEIGTDAPGEIRQFAKFLTLDYCIITAITPEHTVNFRSLEQTYQEELEIVNFSKNIIANRDLIERRHQKEILQQLSTKAGHNSKNLHWFGTSNSNESIVSSGSLVGKGLSTKRIFKVALQNPKDIQKINLEIKSNLLAAHNALIFGAALLLAQKLNLDLKRATSDLQIIKAPPGRGRLLRGKRGAVIIDDSYNNVGANVSIAALDLLYEFQSSRKIAVLGGINEVSAELEKQMHEEVAFHIKANKLQEVILIGELARRYYKPIIHTTKLKYRYFSDPYKAGEHLKDKLVAGMTILVKGSQNGIYSEEVIPPLLQDPKDKVQLVRQGKDWEYKKLQSF